MAFEFCGYELRRDTRELIGPDRTACHLSPKAFAFLLALIERRPRAVPKDELAAVLWPDTHVSDSSLAVLAAEVRAALQDAAVSPRMLRTVHRVGYAFCATVTVRAEPRADVAARWYLLGASQRIVLPTGAIVLGRDPDCDVHCPSPGVSRRHVRMIVTETGLELEDLGSKNGVYVNDRRVIGTTSLSAGDRLVMGATTFRVHTTDEPTETACAESDE
jgi:DNA-binding winged helix-turn-helix (wHTH) protein